jgi:hypothetical protein
VVLVNPILTPTTKFEVHDRNLGRDDAIAEGLVTADLFDRCADVCFRLFARGTELAAQRGLILVDTKYELGLLGDEIVLLDLQYAGGSLGSGQPLGEPTPAWALSVAPGLEAQILSGGCAYPGPVAVEIRKCGVVMSGNLGSRQYTIVHRGMGV